MLIFEDPRIFLRASNKNAYDKVLSDIGQHSRISNSIASMPRAMVIPPAG
jgi:hypothetical protein